MKFLKSHKGLTWLIIFWVLMFIGVFIFGGCTEAGTIRTPQVDRLLINNRVYNVRYVNLYESGGGIYVVYPESDTLQVPQIINYRSGKTTTAVVKID